MKLYLQYLYAFILIALLTPSIQAAREEPAAAGAGGARVSERPMAPTSVFSGVAGIAADDPIQEMSQRVISIADAYLAYVTEMGEFVHENVDGFLTSSGYTRRAGEIDPRVHSNLESIIASDVLTWKGLRHNMETFTKDSTISSLDKAGRILSLVFAEHIRFMKSRKSFETHAVKNKLQAIFVHMMEDQEQATELLLNQLLGLMPPAYQADHKKYRPLYIASTDQHEGGTASVKKSALPDKTPIVDIQFPNGYRCKLPDQPKRPILGISPILDGSKGLKTEAAALPESALRIFLSSGVGFMIRPFPTMALTNTLDEVRRLLTGEEVPYRTLSEIYPGYVPTVPTMTEDEAVSVVKKKVKAGKPKKGKGGRRKPKGKGAMATGAFVDATEDHSEEDDGEAPTTEETEEAVAATEAAPTTTSAALADTAGERVDVASTSAAGSAALKETTLHLAEMPTGKYVPLPARSAPKPHAGLTDDQRGMLADIVSMTKVHNYPWPDLVHLVNAMGGKSIGAVNGGIFEFQRPTGAVHIKTYYPHATGGNVNMYTVKSLMRGLAKIGLDKDRLREMSAS